MLAPLQFPLLGGGECRLRYVSFAFRLGVVKTHYGGVVGKYVQKIESSKCVMIVKNWCHYNTI